MNASIRSLAFDEMEGLEGVQRYAMRIALEPHLHSTHGAGTLSEEHFPLATQQADPTKEAVFVKGKITVSF